MRAVHAPSGRVLADRLEVAASFLTRGVGLMFRRRLERGAGLWIDPNNGIHMFFMRFAIDAVFIDGRHRVVKAYPHLGRWRMVPLVLGARSVLELPAGTLDGLALARGDQLEIGPVPEALESPVKGVDPPA